MRQNFSVSKQFALTVSKWAAYLMLIIWLLLTVLVALGNIEIDLEINDNLPLNAYLAVILFVMVLWILVFVVSFLIRLLVGSIVYLIVKLRKIRR